MQRRIIENRSMGSTWGASACWGLAALALFACNADEDELSALEDVDEADAPPIPGAAALSDRSQADRRIPGFGLTLSRSGNDVVIDFAPHVGTPTYALWHSEDPYFTPGDPGSSLVATGASASFTVVDGATLPSARYWRVVADEGGAIATSTTVGTWVQPLVPGYSLLTFPLLDTGVLDAEALVADQPLVTEVWVFDPSSSGFDGWFGTGEANLVWAPGEAVMVTYEGPAATMHRQLGHVPLPSDVDRTLDVGLTLVTVPLALAPTNAATLATSIPTLDQVGDWNTTTQVLDVFSPPSWGVSFTIDPGSGLWLWSNAAGPWPPVGTTATCGDGVVGRAETCDDGNDDDDDGCEATCVRTPPNAGPNAHLAVQGTVLEIAAPEGLLHDDAAFDASAVVVLGADDSSARGGQVSVMADGSFEYTPPPDFWGEDHFTYTIEDAWGATAEGQVELVVRPVNIPLAAVQAGHGGFSIHGTAQFDQVGNPAGAGDINGDGLDDVLVGTPARTFNGIGSAGRVYVVFGKTTTEPVPITAIAAGQGGFVLDPRPLSGNLGATVSGLGDLDGDGLDDFVTGAPSAYSRGEVYVVRGRTATTPINATDVAAGYGGYLVSSEGPGSHLAAAAAAGDVNGDGLPDVVATDSQTSVGGNGVESNNDRSYVVFGQLGTTPVSTSNVVAGLGGFAIHNESASNNHTMTSVDGAGDVNGDGLADLLLGAAYADFAGQDAGRSYVVFGKADGNPVSLAALGAGGFRIDGELAGDNAGYWVESAGDVNGDGLDDVVLGAWAADPHGSASGNAYVVFGKADGLAVNLDDVAVGLGGFVLHGAAASNYTSQTAVGGVGDVNGDGLDDIGVGARLSSASGAWSGRAYVVYGRTDTDPVELSAVAEGVGGFSLDAAAPGDQVGSRIGAAGDVDGDGLADILVSAPHAQPNGFASGRVYVVFGARSSL